MRVPRKAILWLTSYFFIELCPPDVVREHVRQLTTSNNSIINEERKKAEGGDVVDGEVTDVPDQK